jgi:hypothetical protein
MAQLSCYGDLIKPSPPCHLNVSNLLSGLWILDSDYDSMLAKFYVDNPPYFSNSAVMVAQSLVKPA